MIEIEKMNLVSKDLVAERIATLKELFPEIVTESAERESSDSHCIDFDKLRLLLGDEVDEGQERYAFTWPGKANAIRQSQIPSTATLRPCVEKSRGRDGEDGSFDSDNIYIEGDNLEVLKLLQRGYHGKVKMIYIDPPYNTGSDFIYKDSRTSTIAEYREQAGLTGQSNAKTDGRFHAKWCSLLYPRLKLARELLTNDGIIVVSIDENERTNLQLLLNEVFGETNFAGEIVWKNSSKNDQAYISMQHEYMLVYVKDKGANPGNWTERKEGLDEIYAAFEGFRAQYGNDWKAIHKAALNWYKQFPPSNPIYGSKHYSWMDERGVYFPSDISGPNAGQYVYDVKHPVTGKICKMPSTGWRYPQSEMERRISEGLVHFGDDETTAPNNKTYLANTESQSLTSMLFQDGRSASKRLERLFGEKVFSNPKDENVLIKLFTAFGITDGDVVLDFFSGSGSTGDAVAQYCKATGRKVSWILVQLPEDLKDNLRTASGSNKAITRNAINYLERRGQPALLTNLAEERLRLAKNRLVEEADSTQNSLFHEEGQPVDTGFRVFELDESGIEKPEPGQLLLDVVKPDRSEEDIVFEMMLKWGLELTLPIEREEAAGYPVYSVAYGELVCCLVDGLTMEALDAIADMEPRRVLMRDSILTDTLKLNAVQAFKRVEERTGREVELRTV